MDHLLIGVFKRYTGRSIFIWTIFTIIDFVISRISDDRFNILVSIPLFFCVVFGTTTIGMTTGWPLFYRRVSRSIREFWLFVLGINFLNLAFNGLLFFIALKIVGGSPLSFMGTPIQLSFLDIAWLLLIIITLTFAMTRDVKATLAMNALRLSRLSSIQLGAGVWIVVVVFAFFYSRLLCYFLVEGSFLVAIFTHNPFVLNSISKQSRRNFIAGGMVLILGLTACSYQIARAGGDQMAVFLGAAGSKKKVAYADLELVQTPSQLAKWFEGVGKLNVEQTIAAFTKLEALCPPEPTDSPTRVRCYEKNPTENSVYLGGSIDETEIKQLLSDKLLYTKLFALLRARGLAEFSPEVKTLIEDLAKGSGRLSPVAEKTLASHEKKGQEKLWVSISVKSK